MSGVAVIRYLLANNANLTAVVPATRIMSGILPLNTTLPAIDITAVSSIPRNTVSMAASTSLQSERVQVTVHATTYVQQKSILDLVRRACPNTSGTVNGVATDSVLPDTDGPDMKDEDATIFMQSKDFIVKYRATN